MRASTPASCSGRWRSLASALFALVIGALSLRTRGVYFIMITLAFAQMAYYVVAGLARYGGDDGLTIYKRSQFLAACSICRTRCSSITSASRCCSASIYLVWRLVNSRFGMVVQGSRSNDLRMRAIGFPTYPLPAGLLRHRRHDVRARRRAARQQHRFRQPGR